MSDANELISFIASMTGEGNLRVEENLGEGYVRLRVSEAERRQAKHDIQHVEDIVIEMLRNARDAGAKRLYLATSRSDSERTLLFFDDGCGVPVDMHDAIFEARVTSKLESMKMDRWGVHGRGMALFSIRQNVREARVVSSDTGLGSAFVVRADVSVLPERAERLDDLGMEVMNARIKRRLLAGFAHALLHEIGSLVIHLLDARGMNAAVGDEILERDARRLATNGIEAREHHRFRRIVDNEVHARHLLERADVAPLAADDAALQIIRRDMHRSNSDLGGMICRATLDG